MPIFNHNSEERDTDIIRWEAGGRSHVVITIGGEKVADRHLQKSQRVSIHFSDESESEGDSE